MPQILKGQSFADGDLVTGLKLNNIIDLATLLPNSITDQTALTAFDVQSNDYFLIYDASATALRKASVDDLFRSGQTVKFSSISGISGSNLAVSIAGGYFFVVNGNTNISGDLVGTGLVQGSKGKFSTEITIPADTTANRPASPVAGSFRYNTTIAFTEIYNGTAWIPLTTEVPKVYTKSGSVTPATTGTEFTVYTSPALTIPADETWTYQINISTNSGYVTGSTRPDVDAVRFRVYNNATQIFEQFTSGSPYGAHGVNWMFTKALTSVDNGFIFNAKIYSVIALDAVVPYRVVLTKVKTASLSDNASCI